MSDFELTVVSPQTFRAPILIERASPSTRKKFFEFFTVPIRNANTRAAYYRAIQQFLAWSERSGYQHLEDIEPITVAAYIETLQRQAAPPTVKQHMAAIRMLFSWLTEKGILAMNPAREVKTERFSRTEGKPPAFPPLAHVGLSEGDAQRQGVTVRVARLPMSAVLRTEATGETQGFMKALVGGSDDRILGFTMIGSEAGEVMAAVQAAMLANLPYWRLRDAVLVHPTIAEGLGPLFSNVRLGPYNRSRRKVCC